MNTCETKTKAFVEFTREIYKTNDFIPLHIPTFGGNEEKYLAESISERQVSTTGRFIDQFEELLAQRTNSKGSLALVNGTAALQVSLRLCGVREGDEVLTQALSFVATSNAIMYNNAKPVFLDVDKQTMSLSKKALKEFLDEHGEIRGDYCYNKITGKRIKACIPMHTFGFVGPIDEICAICKEWKVKVVEDAAEALGSTYKGHHAGTFGDTGAYSFNGNKVITAGGGGAIVSNITDLTKHGKHLITTAKVPHAWRYFHDEVGYNYRLPNLNAALLCAQMEQLDGFLVSKRELANTYASFFDSIGWDFKKESGECKANYWLMNIELRDREERDEFLRECNAAGVMTRPIWDLLCEMPMFKSCYRDEQKNASWLADRVVSIPSSVP